MAGAYMAHFASHGYNAVAVGEISAIVASPIDVPIM